MLNKTQKKINAEKFQQQKNNLFETVKIKLDVLKSEKIIGLN